MGKTKIFISVTVMALAATMLGFTGCNRYRSPEDRITHKMEHIGHHLGLTEPQQGKLDEVRDEILQARNAIHNDHRHFFDEVINQVKSDQIDEAMVLDLLDRHHSLMRQAAPRIIAKVSQFHATLTPEQKAEAVEHLTWFKEKRMH